MQINSVERGLNSQCSVQKSQDLNGGTLIACSWPMTSVDVWFSHHHPAYWLQSTSVLIQRGSL